MTLTSKDNDPYRTITQLQRRLRETEHQLGQTLNVLHQMTLKRRLTWWSYLPFASEWLLHEDHLRKDASDVLNYIRNYNAGRSL